MKSLISNFSITALTLLTLSSCQTIDTRGQYVDDSAISQLENKEMTKDEVIELIGTPTIIPDYTPNTWYYIQRSLSKRAWFDPKVIEQRIVEIEFNKNDLVQRVNVIKNSNKEGVKVISEYTETYGTELNSIQKFVRNIGRFNKTTEGKKGKKK